MMNTVLKSRKLAFGIRLKVILVLFVPAAYYFLSFPFINIIIPSETTLLFVFFRFLTGYQHRSTIEISRLKPKAAGRIGFIKGLKSY